MISQDAIDLIVREEVSGQTYFTRHYQNPEWPGGASGVTVAIGYDLGYASAAKIRADWGGLVDSAMLQAMVECAGVKGEAARQVAAQMHNRISIPWDKAMQVFMNRDIPQWTLASHNALPNFDLLNPTCAGVIVSLDYNRGCGGYTSDGDRYVEMRGIKAAMIARQFDRIPDLLDHMARLWPNSGVAGRRHREAALFRKGLAMPMIPMKVDHPAADATVIASGRDDQKARTAPPKTTTTQNTSAGGAVIAATGAAISAGMSWAHVAEIGLLVAVVAALAWAAVYIHRNPPPD